MGFQIHKQLNSICKKEMSGSVLGSLHFSQSDTNINFCSTLINQESYYHKLIQEANVIIFKNLKEDKKYRIRINNNLNSNRSVITLSVIGLYIHIQFCALKNAIRSYIVLISCQSIRDEHLNLKWQYVHVQCIK